MELSWQCPKCWETHGLDEPFPKDKREMLCPLHRLAKLKEDKKKILDDAICVCKWIDKWDRLNEIKVLKNAEGNEYCLHIVDGRNTQESGYTMHEMLRKCAHMMNAKV